MDLSVRDSTLTCVRALFGFGFWQGRQGGGSSGRGNCVEETKI